MVFERAEGKRARNLGRRKLDLIDGQLLFDGRPVVTYPPPRGGESRFVTTGAIGGNVPPAVGETPGCSLCGESRG